MTQASVGIFTVAANAADADYSYLRFDRPPPTEYSSHFLFTF